MKQEIVSYGIVQKDGRGLDLVVEKAKQRMARYHVVRFTIIRMHSNASLESCAKHALRGRRPGCRSRASSAKQANILILHA